MDIQIGNFSSLFEVGVALNLSFSLFGQVRDIGKRNIERSIQKVFDRWDDEDNALKRTKSKADNHNLHKGAKEVVIKDFQGVSALATVKEKFWIKLTTAGAVFCFLMLCFCAIFGQENCNGLFMGSNFTISPKLMISLAVVGSAIMPVAMLRMGIFWSRRRKDILNNTDTCQKIADECNNLAQNAASDLDDSVDKEG